MIKVSHSDTLVDVIEKIQKEDSNDIILDFPLGHSILHSYISLKIIKSKSEGKNLVIATSDIIATKIGKKLGIKYSFIKDREYIEKQGEKSGSIMQHNFSFLEYLIFEIKRYYKNIIKLIKRDKKINSITYYGIKYKKNPGIGFFFIGLLLSLFLLIFVFYFAINKTTITITPEITVKKNARNFIFQESIDNVLLKDNKYILISSIETPYSIQESFIPTDIDIKTSQKAIGKIKMVNTLPQEVNLVPKTRVMSASGIVFETQKWIVLPPTITDNFGKKILGEQQVEVTAQDYDISGTYIGSRGNIKKDTTLSLPGLTGENANTIYAQSVQDFSGGKDDFRRKVSKKDLENAKKTLEQKLKNEVLRKLNRIVEEKNKKDKTEIGILLINDIIEYSNISIFTGSTQVGTITDSFFLQGDIIGRTYTYDKKEVTNKLKTVIKEMILEGVESILLIDENSLKVTQVLSRKESPFEVKATVEIDTFVSHDFLSENNSYTDKLKNSIRGLSREDAIKLLINDPKISNVVIEIRPFFLKTISNIVENIEFRLKDS